MSKIRKALASSAGVVDIQSVMVGVIISAIVAGTAIVSLIGFTRMMSDDNTRTTLKTFSIGLESYYTDKDRYPATVTELADGKYVPQSYKNIPITELCYVPVAGTQPQAYVATAKSAATGTNFSIIPDAENAAETDIYPITGTGTPCKK
jgi:type II secretory pathway pseudopilin PulG